MNNRPLLFPPLEPPPEKGGWNPDFPPVMHFVDLENCCSKPWRFLKAHPGYDAAKNREGRAAALLLVHDFLKMPENRGQIAALKDKYKGAIIVPVRSMEGGRKNRIPEMLAEYIGQNTGLDVDANIVQSNKACRTGSDEWRRFAFRPSFSGHVTPNRSYILVDDVFTCGGSFNDLRLHIERNGGKVALTAALSTGGRGDKIAPEPQLLNSLVGRFSVNKLNSFLKEVNLYGGSYKELTSPEAVALRRAASLDEARDRILAARREGRAYLGAESLQEAEYKTNPITPPCIFGRGPRR